jgi:hypothetical protein
MAIAQQLDFGSRAAAFECGPDPDDDLVDNPADDEAIDALPEPARVVAKPARRKK